MMYYDIYNCISQNTKQKEDLQSIISNLQPNCCFKVESPKVGKHIGGKWLSHNTKHRKDNQLQTWNSPAE